MHYCTLKIYVNLDLCIFSFFREYILETNHSSVKSAHVLSDSRATWHVIDWRTQRWNPTSVPRVTRRSTGRLTSTPTWGRTPRSKRSSVRSVGRDSTRRLTWKFTVIRIPGGRNLFLTTCHVCPFYQHTQIILALTWDFSTYRICTKASLSLNARADSDLCIGTGGLTFSFRLQLHPYFVNRSSLHRLSWATR